MAIISCNGQIFDATTNAYTLIYRGLWLIQNFSVKDMFGTC